MRNQVYIGNLEQLKRRNINYKSKKRYVVPKENRIVCENTHEAIISKQDFDLANEIISKNKTFKKTKHDYLFKGLLYCADCGARLHLTFSNYALKKYGEYRYATICYTHSKMYHMCTRHSNNLKILEEVLLKNIKEVCLKYLNESLPKELYLIGQEKLKKDEKTKEYKTKIENLDREISNTTIYIKNLYVDKIKGIINEENFKELSEQFELERKNNIEEREKYVKLISNNVVEKDNSKELTEIINKFLNFEEPSKELLQQLIDKVTISEDSEITIFFKFEALNNIESPRIEKKCKVLPHNTRHMQVS